MQQDPPRSWRTSAGEWLLSALLAGPFLALYIYVDRHPSGWGVLLLHGVSALLVVVPLVENAAFWAVEASWPDKPHEVITGPQVLAIVLGLTTALVLVPIVLTEPSQTAMAPAVDAVARGLWSLGSVACGVRAARPRPGGPGMALACWLWLSAVWVWTQGPVRGVFGLALVALMVGALLLSLARRRS